jgi:hypothetical protein
LTSATGQLFDSWVFVAFIQMGFRIRGSKCHGHCRDNPLPDYNSRGVDL